MRYHVLICASLLAASLTAVVGCGGSGGSGNNAVVSGKVTLAGKGLPGGNITFYPGGSADKSRTASIKGDGTYSVPDVARGECKVTVDTSSLKSMPQVQKGTDMPGMGGDTVKYVPIDAKYAKPETSGLSTNVDRAAFTYDVEVK